MTDAQDLILDKLVGSKVGVNWPDGPLALAASMLDGDKPIQFGKTDNDRGAKTEIAKRLGYPPLLCEAIQGAVRGLKSEEDRRSFAMLVFRSVSVPGRPKTIKARDQNRLAAEIAIRVHPLLCQPDCPAVVAFERWVNSPDTSHVAVSALRHATCHFAKRPVWSGSLNDYSGTPATRLLVTLDQAMTGILLGKSESGWGSLRESLRLVVTERGIGEAAKLCVDIARQCGLAVEVL